jgi:hypothetical protein
MINIPENKQAFKLKGWVSEFSGWNLHLFSVHRGRLIQRFQVLDPMNKLGGKF